MAEAARSRVFKTAYRDSVELMRIAADLERLPGVARAGALMATPANLRLLAEARLIGEPEPDAGPSDLVIAVRAADERSAATALERAEVLLAPPASPARSDGERVPPATLRDGVGELPGANLAVISTPGPYATAEALKALKRGLHVFLFSAHVPIEDEVELKRLAERKHLLMMGPDCGTAIIDGVPIGFANVVRRGRIGVVGASGTGIQQVACLLDRIGEGISQAIGVGGRDLDGRIGGVMTLAALRRLSAAPGTEAIVLLSKPPAADVAARVLGAAAGCGKPVVVTFLGEAGGPGAAGVARTATFEEAALRAAALTRSSPGSAALRSAVGPGGAGAAETAAPGEILGLFCGGSLADEAEVVLRAAPHGPRRRRLLDLGAEEFTAGRPHPMIDPRLRNEKIVEAGGDPRVALVLLDVVLGYNAHPDPAGALAPAVEEARRVAAQGGRRLSIVASVCGTPGDPQGLGRQERRLAAAGVVVATSNAEAARRAAGLVRA